MSKQKKVLAVLVLLPLALLALTAQREPDSIIVGGADESTVHGITASSTLETLIASVAPRFVLQYADELQYHEMAPISSGLETLLTGVAARFRIQYANENRVHTFTSPPAGLTDLFDSVLDRIVLQFADENRPYSLAYPVALIDDNAPPEVSGIEASPTGGSTVVIRWNTDEFATSEVRYGTSPGNYSQTVTDSLYVKDHEVLLTNLEVGQRYYYVISSTDQSGNRYESAEDSFTIVTDSYLFLPAVVR